MNDHPFSRGREFLKDNIRKNIDFSQTGQALGHPAPDIQKPHNPETDKGVLPRYKHWENVSDLSVKDAILNRQSRRNYSSTPITCSDLSFLLWATQGIREQVNQYTALRNVPSAGCRHAFETYIAVMHVDGLQKGMYRYLPLQHEVEIIYIDKQLGSKIAEAALNQRFLRRASAVFVWTVVPERMEWRYGEAAHKVIAIDAGHVGQNLYLASESIGAGTCSIAAYDQQAMDALVQVDGVDEFVVYMASVGRVNQIDEGNV